MTSLSFKYLQILSSHVMLCQGFILLICRSLCRQFLHVITEKHGLLGWDQVTEFAVDLRNSWPAFALCLAHYTFALWSAVWSVWLFFLVNLSREFSPSHFYQQSHQPETGVAIHAQAITLPKPCLTDNVACLYQKPLLSFSIISSFHHSGLLLISFVQLIFSEQTALDFFWSNLALLLLTVKPMVCISL